MNNLFTNGRKALCGLSAVCISMLGTGIENAAAQSFDTEEAPMLRGVTKHIKNGWMVDPVFTVGETDYNGADYSMDRFGYRVPGLLDGMYAFRSKSADVNVVANHELQDGRGYPYMLANGTVLTGARITSFRISKIDRTISGASLAYDMIYDRYYDEVTDQSQLDEGANPGSMDGMDRLCSASGIEAGKYGFMDNLFFTGEETSPPFDVRGGQEFVLDVDAEKLYCIPAVGRAAWESMCVLDNMNSNKVVLIGGDDREAAPLLMYIGQKNASYHNDAPAVLRRNGLAKGHLFVWVSDDYAVNGEIDPSTWSGTGTSRTGKFVKIAHYDPSMAGMAGYDADGWADLDTQDALGDAIGKFQFSRPEDVATNPQDGTQVVFASTGRGGFANDSDLWGTTYLVDVNDQSLANALNGSLGSINNIEAEITILYDGDDAGNGQFASPDHGLRSPDNLDWAADGYIYINEDRSVGDFCQGSGVEASVWQLNPQSGVMTRILEMDRNAVPFTQVDDDPTDCGNWESSGTIDVTSLFKTRLGETMLLLNVQGHSIDGTTIGGNSDLGEGGQLIFASRMVTPVHYRKGDINTGSLNIENDAIELYPNPATELVNLTEASEVRVFDSFGKLVIEESNIRTIDVNNFEPGVYIVETNRNKSHKLVIQ